MDHSSIRWRYYAEDLVFGVGDRETNLLKYVAARYRIGSALDVACGDGEAAILLAGWAQNVTALDHDPERIKKVDLKSSTAGVRLKTACADMRDLSSVYKQKCSLVTCLRNSLSRLVDEYDIWGTLVQIYLALKPGGLLIIQNFDYDRLFRDKKYFINQMNEYYRSRGVKITYNNGPEKQNAEFVLETSGKPDRNGQKKRVVVPVRPIFSKELDLWLAELGFRKVDNCREAAINNYEGKTWHTLAVVIRPGQPDDQKEADPCV